MIDYRMSYLLATNKGRRRADCFLKETNLTYEAMNREIKEINRVAASANLAGISIEKDEVIIPNCIKKQWVDIYFTNMGHCIVYSEKERKYLVYLHVFGELADYSVFYFQEFLGVSKNTILNDIKNLRTELSENAIQLKYSRKKGFFLDGEEEVIRSQAHKYIGKLMVNFTGEYGLYQIIFQKSAILYAQRRALFTEIIQKFQLAFVPSRMEEMTYFLIFITCRATNYSVRIYGENQKLIGKLTAYKASRYFVEQLTDLCNPTMEGFYLTTVFMTVLQGEMQDATLEFLLTCATEIIHEVERLAAIEFTHYRRLLLDLFYHLVPAYFRIKFHFSLNNVLIDKIVAQYGEVYEITSVALLPLKKILGKSIPKEEVGFFTILFGGEILNQRKQQDVEKLQALIVCPSGISSSLIMKSELTTLFPKMDFLETNSFTQFEALANEHYDLIFSSVPIQSTVKVYVINPIMTEWEKNELLRKVYQDRSIPIRVFPSIIEIINMLLPYVSLKEGLNKKKVYELVHKKINRKINGKEGDKPMLSELLTAEMIVFSDEEMDWEEAIAFAAKPLRKTNKISANYVQAMIAKVKNYGPFIHIGKGVALPHARPEDGVNELGMSLLKVTKPINLLHDEEHPIRMFICLAAIDSEVHLKALASLTKILSDKQKLEYLLNATNKNEVIQLLKGEA